MLSCCRIPWRGYIPRGAIPHQQANERSQHSPPLSGQQTAGCHARAACSPAARLCLQELPGFPNQCSPCPSPGQPCVRALLPARGSLKPHLCCAQAGLASLPDSLVQDTCHCQNCSLICFRLISFGLLGDWVFIFSFDLSCHSLLSRSV